MKISKKVYSIVDSMDTAEKEAMIEIDLESRNLIPTNQFISDKRNSRKGVNNIRKSYSAVITTSNLVQDRVVISAKRTERNRYYRTRIKNIVKEVHEAVEASDKVAATTAFRTANKQIHLLVSKGFIKKSTAARKVSRLHKMVKKLEE